MTATQSRDGDRRDYVDVADAIRDLSPRPRREHHELYARIVTSVGLGNTDDHLRNHGFLAEPGEWALSPSFDVNPNPETGRSRATSIAGADAPPDEVDGLLALAQDCSLTVQQARAMIGRVAAALADWKGAARRRGIGEREIAMMAAAITPRLESLASEGARS